jgi:hypothetical protein
MRAWGGLQNLRSPAFERVVVWSAVPLLEIHVMHAPPSHDASVPIS